MKIRRMICSAGATGFFFDDQRAIKAGARHDGFAYEGRPSTEGFKRIRQAGESVSIMLLLENGAVAVGDAAAVQYSGAGGRDPLFLAESFLPVLRRTVAPFLEGMELRSFREEAAAIENLSDSGRRLHTALRYGISQALLDAHALAKGRPKAQVVCEEYGLPPIAEPVPIFGQSGDERHLGADKMILKGVDVLPHALINNVDEKLGRDGSLLKEYLRWLSARIRKLRASDAYNPSIHIDVYGTTGLIHGNNPSKVADYLAGLEADAGGFKLYVEGPVDMEAKAPQIGTLKSIRDRLKALGSGVKIVADEWCNTFEDVKEFCDAQCCDMAQIKTPDLGGVQNIVESVLHCKAHGVEAYQGGTCNETDVSARCCVHLALAARADRMLAKPGMGFDEGYSIVKNEMSRTIALMRAQEGR